MHGTDVDPRELALQIVDIVALRPEVELCYMGIANKCFEILENRRNGSDSWDGRPESRLGLIGGNSEEDDGAAGSEGEEEEDEEDVAEDAVEDETGHVEEEEAETDSEEEDQEDESDSEDEGESHDRGKGMASLRLRLREILFYDDKVAIFKARHGRL